VEKGFLVRSEKSFFSSQQFEKIFSSSRASREFSSRGANSKKKIELNKKGEKMREK
jgi:hypothetical protein